MPRSDGLILHCPFWGDAGDVSGVGVNGADTGVTYPSDLIGGQVRKFALYGGDGDFTSFAGLHFGPTMTVAAWFRFDDLSVSRMMVGEWANPGNTWLLYWQSAGPQGLVLYTPGGASYALWAPTVGEWYHVACANESAGTRYCVNGSQLTTVNAAPTWSSTANHFQIGKAAGLHLFGGVADVRAYNRALSAAEILNLYQRRYPLAA